MTNTRPGYCDGKDVWVEQKHLFKKHAEFIRPMGECADIGCSNAKMEYIKSKFNIDVTQVNTKDFNYDYIGVAYKNKFDTIFCFEVLEHLQNPLFFMGQLKEMLKPGGIIYLSTPGRPKILWTEHHFMEYKPNHLKKWILDPLELMVVRRKKIRTPHTVWFHLSGLRPFLRIFLNFTNIYEIIK